MKSILRVVTLLALGGGLGAIANAVSPVGLSWKEPLGKGLEAQVAAAGLAPVALDALRSLLDKGQALLVDARPEDEYRTGHLQGAISLPWGEVEARKRRIDGLPRGRPLVVYCANRFCESSLRLGMEFQKAGYSDIGVLVDGYDAWWDRGGTVEQN